MGPDSTTPLSILALRPPYFVSVPTLRVYLTQNILSFLVILGRDGVRYNIFIFDEFSHCGNKLVFLNLLEILCKFLKIAKILEIPPSPKGRRGRDGIEVL